MKARGRRQAAFCLPPSAFCLYRWLVEPLQNNVMNGPLTVLSGVFAERYAIERELGRGGSAIVYLARDIQRGHAVALKVLRPEFVESLGAERFLREIKLSEQLHHPHILPVLDSGNRGGRLYFSLPHMEGGSLRDRLDREKQLPLETVVAIARTVSGALAHAHAKGLIHRDVKPENILFTSGQACLGDFGIARALERAAGETTTSTSVVRGTPHYMSPEQATGSTKIDGRSDLYSFACVIYEMLSGIQPFVGPTPQSVIAQRLVHMPRPIRTFRPTLPKAVESVLARAFSVAAVDRYQTATDLLQALERAAQALPSTPGPTRWSRLGWRRRAAIGALGAAALVVAIAAVLKMTADANPPGNPVPENDQRRIAALYLDNLTPSTLPGHLVDGISEYLIDQLGGVRALYVISPNGVRPFRTSVAPVDSIGRALRVGTIVSGSVARSGNTMRVSYRLIDARDGRQISSEQLELPWAELFALQSELANRVAFSLRRQLGQEIALRENRGETRSFAAWEAAQLASVMLQRASENALRRADATTPLLLLQADSLYARAESLDQGWATPSVRRGFIALALATHSVIPGQSAPPPHAGDTAYTRLNPSLRGARWVERALEHADAALRREPRSPRALALRGDARVALVTAGVPGHDSAAALAERDLRDAVALRPDLAPAWSALATLFRQQGRFADAAAAAKSAFEADAFFETRRIVSVALFAALYAEQFDDARAWCRHGLTHYAGDPRFTECELTLLGWTGSSRADAATAWNTLTAIEQRDSVGMLAQAWGYRRLMVASVLARAGLRDSARKVLALVQARPSPDPARRSTAIHEASVMLLLDDREAALRRLSEYVEAAPHMRAFVAAYPWFRSLSGDPRFAALVGQRPDQPASSPLR